MPNNKWDEDHIENLLRDFPAIKDERSKEQVLQRLKNEHKPKAKPKRWIPLLVAALAFLTFGVLLASLLGQNGNDSATDTSGSDSSEESADTSITAVDEDGAESEPADSESSDTVGDAEDGSDTFTAMEEEVLISASSVYEEDLNGKTLFTLGMTQNAVVIPVSFLVSNESLEEDLGTADVDAAELYNRYAAELDEEALGFDNYHPYSGTIIATEQGIEHILPDGHNYDMASATMNVYFNSLSASFPEAEIAIVNEDGEAAEFDQMGPVQPIDPSDRNIAYYSFATANGSNHLIPGYDMPFDTAVEALEAMKSSPNDLYTSLIPAELDFEVSETQETVTVKFNDSIDFDSYDYEAILDMIEGMVLTTDSFGKELLLDNTAAESWDRFNFTEALPVPAGINLMEFNN